MGKLGSDLRVNVKGAIPVPSTIWSYVKKLRLCQTGLAWCFLFCSVFDISFSALTLLVGQQEGHLVWKKN